MYGVFEYIMISGNTFLVSVLTGAVFAFTMSMTLPTYFNLGGEIIYPEGEAHSTTMFTVGMNVFGLTVIEIVKVVEAKGNESEAKNGLLWTAVFQGAFFLIGLLLLIGRVFEFFTTELVMMFGYFNLEVPVGNKFKLIKVTKEDLKRSKTNLETEIEAKGIESKSFEE